MFFSYSSVFYEFSAKNSEKQKENWSFLPYRDFHSETENSPVTPLCMLFSPELTFTTWPDSYTHELFQNFKTEMTRQVTELEIYTHTHTFVLFFGKAYCQEILPVHTRMLTKFEFLYSRFPLSGATLPNSGYCIVKRKVGHDHRLAILRINQLWEIKPVTHKEAAP